jgi:hypothetical protein
MNEKSDAEFINRISELLFGYREASSDEIFARITMLQEFERDGTASDSDDSDLLTEADAEQLRRDLDAQLGPSPAAAHQ